MSSRYTPYKRAPAARRTATRSRATYRAPAPAAYRRPAVSRRRATQYKRRVYNNGSGIARTVGRYGGAAIGGYLGGPPGAAIGSAVGSKAGDLFSQITGMGDYRVSYNTVVNPSQTPAFKTKGRSVFISHREYIQDIITAPVAGAFAIDSFEINPALSSTFPWLATIAQNFEQYRIHGMVFHYKSNSADALNSVNTALGTVILATQYNVLLDPFRNKQEMENYEFGCSTRPSADVLHPVECDPKVTSFGPIFDVKLGGNDKGDNRLYCPGRFSIASVGQQGTSVNIGELWVTYDIEFYKPRMGDTASQMSQWKSSLGHSTTMPFGSQRNISESSDFDAVTLTTNQIVFDANFTGQVEVFIVWRGPTAGVVITGPALIPDYALSGGITNLDLAYGPINSTSDPGTGRLTMMFVNYFSVVNGGTITFSGGSWTGIARSDTFVQTIPNTIQLYMAENN